jgi:opacity protein-like surface antigen
MVGAVIRRLLLTAWLASAPVFAPSAHAEWYAGAYGGLANPSGLSNARVSSSTIAGGVRDARVIDIELEDSTVWGAKVGYFFTNSPWIGVETDLYTLRPDLKEQVTVGGVPGRAFADTLPAMALRVTTGVVNLIIRSPAINERFQPYGGMGYGAFMTTSSKSKTSISPGLNMFAGARYVLTEKLALFGEFKFNRSTLTFSGIEGKYSTQLFVFGVMWHFKDQPGVLSNAAR